MKIYCKYCVLLQLNVSLQSLKHAMTSHRPKDLAIDWRDRVKVKKTTSQYNWPTTNNTFENLLSSLTAASQGFKLSQKC